MGLKITEKKSRLLCEDDVIKAVDKHTNDDGSLDDDISCILEEVKDYRDKIAYAIEKTTMNIMSESKLSLTCPRVFMFNLKDENIDHSKVQKDLKKQISEGCVVLPDCVEFIGVEEPIVILT